MAYFHSMAPLSAILLENSPGLTTNTQDVAEWNELLWTLTHSSLF